MPSRALLRCARAENVASRPVTIWATGRGLNSLGLLEDGKVDERTGTTPRPRSISRLEYRNCWPQLRT